MLPEKIDLGHFQKRQLGFILHINEEYGYEENTLLGFKLPYFQRGSVWSKEQKIKLIESIWLGII